MPYKDIQKRRAAHRVYTKNWTEANPEKSDQIKKEYNRRLIERIGLDEFRRLNREKAKAWREKNKQRALEINRQSMRRNRANVTRYRRLKKYGLDATAFEALLKAQHGKCAICARAFGDGVRLHVDHCHASNVVRGLLCSTCNSGLGHFKDNEEFLMSAAKYLKARKR